MNKTIITVVGKDVVGIIAKVCSYLASKQIVDTTHIDSFDQLSADLETLGKEIGVQVKCQREEIFNMMHRI